MPAELLEGDAVEGGDPVDVHADLVVELHGARVDEPEQDGAGDLRRDGRQVEAGLGLHGPRGLAEVDRARCAGPLPRPGRPHARDAAARSAERDRLVEHRVEARRQVVAERGVDGI